MSAVAAGIASAVRFDSSGGYSGTGKGGTRPNPHGAGRGIFGSSKR